MDENPGILDYTWFSDEAWFHLSGYVNSQKWKPACTVRGTLPFTESRRVLFVIIATLRGESKQASRIPPHD
jgi:hypothetical protein